jgi:hypothetical protein
MKIGEQLRALADGLATWAQNNSAKVEVASDPVHLLGLLAQSPGSARVVLMFDSEDVQQPDETGHVVRRFLAVVSRGRGLSIERGDNLLEGSAGGRPLFELIEEVRDNLRTVEFTAQDTPARTEYRATRRLALEDATIDAYQIEIATRTFLP